MDKCCDYSGALWCGTAKSTINSNFTLLVDGVMMLRNTIYMSFSSMAVIKMKF